MYIYFDDDDNGDKRTYKLREPKKATNFSAMQTFSAEKQTVCAFEKAAEINVYTTNSSNDGNKFNATKSPTTMPNKTFR